MSAVSSEKVSIFHDRIVQLMEFLIVSQWNSDDDKADFASYLIDQMLIKEHLDYKRNPDKNLVRIFQKYADDKQMTDSYLKQK